MQTLSRRSFLAASAAGLAVTPHSSTPTSASAHPTPFLPAPVTIKPAPPKKPDEYEFRPNALFLTWHRDPTTTMTVQWVGAPGETADTHVYHRAVTPAFRLPLAAVLGVTQAPDLPGWTARPTGAKPFPTTNLKVFRCELTGLTPGTDYDFRIGLRSPTYRFRTMPARATRPIQFISGGDCGVNPHTVANNIQAARQDPAFAVIGGDLAYENGRTADLVMGFLRNYSKHMIARDGRLIPLIACLGNHEVDGGYGSKRSKAPFFYALFDGLFRDTGYAALDFGDYLSLILLDTGHTSKIAGDQTDWLDRALRARRDHPHVMVVNHVPAYPSARSMEGAAGTGIENRKHWVPLFEKYRVPVILEHHDHTFKRTKPLIDGLAQSDGVLYLGDGSWGQIRSLQPPEKLHFLAASSQDFHLSLHRIQGQDRYHLALDENGRVMDLCRSGQRSSGLVSTRS